MTASTASSSLSSRFCVELPNCAWRLIAPWSVNAPNSLYILLPR